MTTTYLIHVLDASGNVAAMLDTVAVETLNYTRVLNGASAFQLTLRYDHPAAQLLDQKHRAVEVYRYGKNGSAERELTGLVYYANPFEDDDGTAWLIVSGFSLEYELGKRIIDYRDDPLGAGGYSTKEGPAETVMRELVSEQAGPLASGLRAIPGLTVGSSGGAGNTVRGRWTWEHNLLEVLQSLTVSGGIDFYIRRTSGMAFEFVAEQVGRDLTRDTNWPGEPFVLFDPLLGNLGSPSLIKDWKDERTNVILLGQGSGDSRFVYGSLASQVSDTPYSYGEFTLDARENEDGSAAAFITLAQDALLKRRGVERFDFVVPPAVARRQYNDVWALGDTVTVQWGTAYRQNMRIVEVEVNVTGNGEAIRPVMEARNV